MKRLIGAELKQGGPGLDVAHRDAEARPAEDRLLEQELKLGPKRRLSRHARRGRWGGWGRCRTGEAGGRPKCWAQNREAKAQREPDAHREAIALRERAAKTSRLAS